MQMRAITLRPPWGWLAVTGSTLAVTLTTDSTVRGLIAICSGGPYDLSAERQDHVRHALGCTCSGDPLDIASSTCPYHRAGSRLRDEVVQCTGGIIGIAQLVDVHPARGCCGPWGSEGFHYQLYGAERLERIIFVSGRQPGTWYLADQFSRLIPARVSALA